MADLEQVVKQMDRLARNASAAVVEKMPTPKGDCGCGRRKKKLLKSIRTGKSAAEIVKEQLRDLAGKTEKVG